MPTRKAFLTVVCFCCFCVSVNDGRLVAEEVADTPSMPEVGKPLHCVIRGEATCKLGDAPKIQVSLVNQTEVDIYLVGSLDASDCKWRYPLCYFEVTGPDGKQVPSSIPRCGLTNPLRAKDFVKVASNDSFDPYKSVDDYGFFSAHQLSQSNFNRVGQYRIRFIYSTASDDVAKWRGNGGDAELISLLKQVPKTDVKSEEFVVKVVADEK